MGFYKGNKPHRSQVAIWRPGQLPGRHMATPFFTHLILGQIVFRFVPIGVSDEILRRKLVTHVSRKSSS